MKHRHSSAHAHDLEDLAEDAKALLVATADVAEEKVVEARERLTAVLERGRESWCHVQDRAVEGAKLTGKAVRKHPYQALGFAFGFGAILGLFMARRN